MKAVVLFEGHPEAHVHIFKDSDKGLKGSRAASFGSSGTNPCYEKKARISDLLLHGEITKDCSTTGIHRGCPSSEGDLRCLLFRTYHVGQWIKDDACKDSGFNGQMLLASF